MPLDEHRDQLGNVRRLGWVPPDPPHLMMRAARTNIQTLRSNNGLPPLIPKSQWQPVDFVSAFGTKFISDQGQHGSCTGYSAAGALTRQRAMRGFPWVGRLSGAFVYDQINHGQDNGSNIIDSQSSIETDGVPIEDAYPKCLFKANRVPTGASMYREDVAITLATSDECATALQMGMLPQVPIYVFNGFEKFDGNGVAGVSNKQQGNHSIYLAGLIPIASEWYFLMVNSWRADWGPFVKSNPQWGGCCLLRAAHIDNVADAEDGYCHANSPINPGTP